MPRVTLDQTLEMYYEDDDYTDPWREPEAVVLHHGNAKNSFLWYAWVPLLARQYRVVRLGRPRLRPFFHTARGLRLVVEQLRRRPSWFVGPP